MSITSAGFIALLVLPGLDHRFGWSRMPATAAIAGDLLMLPGWVGIFRVFRANSFTSSTIELAADQRVISTGPYAIIRHPMYAAALLMLLGIPSSLGSWWGVLVVLALPPALIWRMRSDSSAAICRAMSHIRARCVTGCCRASGEGAGVRQVASRQSAGRF